MITLEVTGLDRTRAKLDGIAKGVKDLSPAFNDMKVKIISLFKKNFDDKGSTLGSRWAARKKNYPWPILQRTGKLKGAWEDKVQKLSLVIKNPTEYAGYHQFGTRILPVRAIVGIPNNVKDVIIEAVEKYIKSLTK